MPVPCVPKCSSKARYMVDHQKMHASATRSRVADPCSEMTNTQQSGASWYVHINCSPEKARQTYHSFCSHVIAGQDKASSPLAHTMSTETEKSIHADTFARLPRCDTLWERTSQSAPWQSRLSRHKLCRTTYQTKVVYSHMKCACRHIFTILDE